MAVLIVAVVAVVIVMSLKGRDQGTPVPAATVQPVAVETVQPVTADNVQTESIAENPGNVTEATEPQPETTLDIHSNLAEMLADENVQANQLPSDAQIQVDNLSVNTDLPAEWKNVVLLGTDERLLDENSRTDSIIICSVNASTGQVKLISVLRDMAVDFYDLGRYSGTYRINAANLFGGPELVMKKLNECFSLNIESYVLVNFYGFQEMAEIVGGIDIDVSEAEMTQINKNVVQQWKFAQQAGVDESDLPDPVKLTTYGPNTHLDGRQTLGYARIRKIDSDISRTERQRVVLEAMAKKLKGKSAMELAGLAASLLPYMKTNLKLEEMLALAYPFLSQDASMAKTYVPITGTYNPQTRDGQSMLYDCDWAANTAEIHAFIYGN